MQIIGAFLFGAVIGWITYYTMRYAKNRAALTDLVVVIGALGGAVVLNIFPVTSNLFAWYTLGLAVGFFGYFVLTWLTEGKAPTLYFILTGGERRIAMDGWAVAESEDREKFGNIRRLKELATGEGKGWAQRVSFRVNPVDHILQSGVRKYEVRVDVTGARDRGELIDIFNFMHDKCSHIDGFG